MDGGGDDSIEEISLTKKTIPGTKSVLTDADLIKGIVIHIRSLTGKSDSKNRLISMLENLFSGLNMQEKKRILTEEYGMVMTTELEGRIQAMCNWSETIMELSLERGIKQGIERGILQERMNAIGRMLKAGITKEQILSCGYTEDEFAKAEDGLYACT